MCTHQSHFQRDKAGGYGIQGLARFFVKKIDGCYYNVVGTKNTIFIHKSYHERISRSEIFVKVD